MSKRNFEQLYYTLKDEYNQMQKDNNDIYKEYESTIQMLTDSIKELQNQRSAMTKKLSEIEKEKENLQRKNHDKIIDIQDLNKQNEKLNQEIKKIKEDKRIKDTKIIILENDTEHFQKLIRQNEAIIDELNIKLEEALEDNITIQTEFEIYKQIMGEQLMRKEEELKEIKNDMFSKNMMIKKLRNKKIEISPIKKKILQLKFKAGESTNKKNKNKIKNRIVHYNTYLNSCVGFTFPKKNDIFKKIALNLSRKKDIIYQTYNKNSNIISLPLLSSGKISLNKYKCKFINLNSNSATNNFDKNKSIKFKTPSKNKISKINNSINDYSLYTNKKNYVDINEFKQINKFMIDNVNDDITYLKNDETTVDLTTFMNENNNSLSVDNDYSTNLLYDDKILREEPIIYNTKMIDIEPFKDVFLKKLLKSKKLSNNLEKLLNLNHQKKEKKFNKFKKSNLFKRKIGYMIK